jgi:hypothetical protein
MPELNPETLGDDDPRRPLKLIKVGVFPFDERNTRFSAYTTWYNPQWKGCCEHKVEALNGTEAKKLAIAEHKERCVDG